MAPFRQLPFIDLPLFCFISANVSRPPPGLGSGGAVSEAVQLGREDSTEALWEEDPLHKISCGRQTIKQLGENVRVS